MPFRRTEHYAHRGSSPPARAPWGNQKAPCMAPRSCLEEAGNSDFCSRCPGTSVGRSVGPRKSLLTGSQLGQFQLPISLYKETFSEASFGAVIALWQMWAAGIHCHEAPLLEEFICLMSRYSFLVLIHRSAKWEGNLEITWLLLFHVRKQRLREVS